MNIFDKFVNAVVAHPKFWTSVAVLFGILVQALTGVAFEVGVPNQPDLTP